MMRVSNAGVLAAAVIAAVVGGCAVKPGEKAAEGPGMYENPIVSGDWSDPGVIRVGEDYYACRSSFGWQPGIPIIHSKDLRHWEYVGHAFQTHAKLLPGDTRMGIWGLEMNYNAGTRQFQIYAPTRDGEVFVYSSAKPEGPYTQTSLGANLGIDPGVFTDEDGAIYFLTNKGVIQKLSPDGLKIEKTVATIDKSKYKLFEGPDIFRYGGYCYLLFSDGGTLPHEPSTISTLRAKQLEGPWEEEPGGPTMFSTDKGAKFEAPAHGTLLETQHGEWFLTYHAHETAYYTLGREMLMEPVEWTADGWWRPVGGKVPSTRAVAPKLKEVPLKLAQSDAFDKPGLGLQWFFLCAPDFSGKSWQVDAQKKVLRVMTQPGDMGSLSALPAIFQQRVIDKKFSFETTLTFDAKEGREAAGLHMYHDPLMNFWVALTARNGEKWIEVGKYNLGVRSEVAAVKYGGGATVHLRMVVAEETAVCSFSADGKKWEQAGTPIYFGASGHHLREGKRGDPDLGWVGRYKEKGATPEQINGAAGNQRQANRGGNIWTAGTFGVFSVRDGAGGERAAAFERFVVRTER